MEFTCALTDDLNAIQATCFLTGMIMGAMCMLAANALMQTYHTPDESDSESVEGDDNAAPSVLSACGEITESVAEVKPVDTEWTETTESTESTDATAAQRMRAKFTKLVQRHKFLKR